MLLTNMKTRFTACASRLAEAFISLKHNLSNSTVKCFASYNLYRFVGLFLLYSSKQIHKPVDKSLGTIIVFAKLGFSEEIRLLIGKYENKLPRIILVRRGLIKAISSSFLAKNQRRDYLESSEIDSIQIDACTNFWSNVLTFLNKAIDLRLILSGNLVYWAERPIARASSDTPVKFCIYQKETFFTKRAKRTYEYLLERTQPFLGYRIFVFSESSKKLLSKSGVAKDFMVEVVGSIRLNSANIRPFKKSTEENRSIIFFVPSLPTLVDANFIQRENQLFLDLHNNQVSFGLNLIENASSIFPEFNFVVKEKNDSRSLEVLRFFDRIKAFKKNVMLHPPESSLADSVLKNAMCAFGFNSTSLFDSLLSGVPVANLRGKIDEATFGYYFETYGGTLPEITNFSDFTDWIYAIKSNNFNSSWLNLNFDSIENYFSQGFGRYNLSEDHKFYTRIMDICRGSR
jgi:hypothetical protein